MKLLFCLVGFFATVYCRKLPAFVEVCHRNDPKIADCLLKNVEKLRPKFLNGIPELQIPSFNPLLITEASLEGGENFKAIFRKIKIYHADNFIVDKIDFNANEVSLKLALHFPLLRIKSEYNINGRILVLQLNGTGPADGNYTDIRANLEATGVQYTKNGKQYLKLEGRHIDIDIGKLQLRFERLFGDNEELNEQTNKIINDNAQELATELKPVITRIVSEFVFGIVNRLFAKYSYDELFPNN